MGVFQSLSVIALRQVVGTASNAVGIGGAGEAIVDQLSKHFTDHSQKLTSALRIANERAWKALEIALAGDSLWERCKVVLAAAEDRALAQQIRLFLDGTPFRSTDHAPIFRDALKELRAARSRNHLVAEQLSFGDLAKKTCALARYENPKDLLDAEWNVVEQAADHLREFRNLYKILIAKTKSGQRPSILVVAVRYYFRREVETNPELARGLIVAKLDSVQEAQEKRFDALDGALSRQGDELEKMLADLSGVVVEIAGTIKEIDKTTTATRDAVQILVGQVKTLTEQLRIQNREVRPSDSMSMRNEGERQIVKQLLTKFRALPAAERDRPGLLNDLGKLELAAGDFGEAQEKFQKAARMESDPKRQAEAHYNAYQAALQRQDWPAALASIRQAITLDAARFAPFPDRYEPTSILGAGGFGVAFLCHHKFMKANIVVKTLQTDELDCEVDRVFSEAQALGQLNHPSIIRLADCGYADAEGKSRPYLAMDYFDGVNLESYVGKHGPLSPEELLAVAVPVAEALQAAHARGILHRDVKPANILVRREGAGWSVKLIDFGLALRSSMIEGKPSTSGPKAQTTMGKTIAGTMHYAAPEQMGQLPGVAVGAYSDVYGFGKTCYFALLATSDPDGFERNSLPEPWRIFLDHCTGRRLSNRSPDFAAVLAGMRGLSVVVGPPVVVPLAGSDGPIGKDSNLTEIERDIKEIEGFGVTIKCEGNDKPLPPYPYERAASDALTVAQWRNQRFWRQYPGCEITVLFADGREAHGVTKLATVRTWEAHDASDAQALAPDASYEPWNGEFCCNYGDSETRSWDEALQYGFVCAGGGAFYSRTLQLLNPGDRVWVKVPGCGFVGVCRVTGCAQPATSFAVATPAGSVLALEILKGGTYHREYLNDPENCEYFVPVRWLQTVPLEKAINEPGLFGNQNTVCKPTAAKWRHTVERLKQKFPAFDK